MMRHFLPPAPFSVSFLLVLALLAGAESVLTACSAPGTEASIEEVVAQPAPDGGPTAPTPATGAADGQPSSTSGAPPAVEGEPPAGSPGANPTGASPGTSTGGTTPTEPATDAGTGMGNDVGTGAVTSGGGAPISRADGGTSPDAGGSSPGTPPGTSGTTASDDAWLHTAGNRILTGNGERWRARGATVHDTRGCGACTANAPSAEGVMRRIDVLVDEWGANLVRLALESYANADGRAHWQGVAADARYLADVERIVRHATNKPGVYVMLSLWREPSVTNFGWPSPATIDTWRRLAETFAHEPRVVFALVNEPDSNYSGFYDADAWTAMNTAVQAIRDVEARLGARKHLIAVQGTGDKARRLDYYLAHPITAGGGENVAYEVHVRNHAADFSKLVEVPARTLPIIIGSFGPSVFAMTDGDCETLMARARSLDLPHVASTFHESCAPEPSLITAVPRAGARDACGPSVTLAPTKWGELVKKALATPR